jgi:NADPH:quinone reductase-like Zn-dependent oxidoreductase
MSGSMVIVEVNRRRAEVSGAAEFLVASRASKLGPVVDRIFPLDEAVKAFQRMEEAKQFGKIVLEIA